MMDALDRRLVAELQHGLEIVERPFAEAARRFDIEEDELIRRIEQLLADGVLTRFGPLFDAGRMGGAITLAAMAVPPDRFDEVAEIVNGFPEVAHNYARDHRLNMWFVVAVDDPARVPEVLREIEERTGLAVLDLPKEDEFFLDLRLAP